MGIKQANKTENWYKSLTKQYNMNTQFKSLYIVVGHISQNNLDFLTSGGFTKICELEWHKLRISYTCLQLKLSPYSFNKKCVRSKNEKLLRPMNSCLELCWNFQLWLQMENISDRKKHEWRKQFNLY